MVVPIKSYRGRFEDLTSTKTYKGREYNLYLTYPTRDTAIKAGEVLQRYGDKVVIVQVVAPPGEFNYALYHRGGY
jgi:hypothetical protein